LFTAARDGKGAIVTTGWSTTVAQEADRAMLIQCDHTPG